MRDVTFGVAADVKEFDTSKEIEKIEDSVFIVQHRMASNSELDDKTMKRLQKMKTGCEKLRDEPIFFNHEIIRLMKIKNILEEWKNIFYKVTLLQEIFEEVHQLILTNCRHQKEYDYIDVDPDKSIRICFCKLCFCSL